MGVFDRLADSARSLRPLALDFTWPRALHALGELLARTYPLTRIGWLVGTLALIGLGDLARRRSAGLKLAALASLPYLVFHFLFQQQVPEPRYTMPYLLFLLWLAAEGIRRAGAVLGRRSLLVESALTSALVIASATLALPALRAYHSAPAPVFAAFAWLEQRRETGILSGHPLFERYFHLRPPGFEALAAGPRLERLREYWRKGGERPVFFLAEAHLGELIEISPREQREVGRWEWPPEVARFIAGSRPNRLDLVRLERPRWFVDEGWQLGHGESDRQIRGRPIRRAHVGAIDSPGFLLLHAEPYAADARDFQVELWLDGERLEARDGRQRLIVARELPVPSFPQPYGLLEARTLREGRPQGAPIHFRSLDYGSAEDPGIAHLDGWSLPELDDEPRLCRWTEVKARSILRVPPRGLKLTIEAMAPLEYLGPSVQVDLYVAGVRLAWARPRQRRFTIEVGVGQDGKPFQELVLLSDHAFVPHRFKRNGDMRQLGVCVYSARVATR
jgi:hypothetical protein